MRAFILALALSACATVPTRPSEGGGSGVRGVFASELMGAHSFDGTSNSGANFTSSGPVWTAIGATNSNTGFCWGSGGSATAGVCLKMDGSVWSLMNGSTAMWSTNGGTGVFSDTFGFSGGQITLSATNGTNLINLTDSSNSKTWKVLNNNDTLTLKGNNNGTTLTVDPNGNGTFTGTMAGTALVMARMADSNSAPTISSGFGSSPSIVTSNGTTSFQINVGTGGSATSGVIGLPTAGNGWTCVCQDITTASATVFLTKQTATATTTCTIGNFNTAGAAAAWVASDKLWCVARAN